VRRALEGFFRRIWWTPRPGLAATLLRPLAALYGRLQRRHVRDAKAAAATLPVPVLVVGNLVVGGAGKTPTVIAVVAGLVRRGHRPGIVSRGHGRRGHAARAVSRDDAAAEAGDEPLLLARRTGVPVFVGRDRIAAARALLQAHPQVDVLVADDGLQHAALSRQAELVVFDERGAGNGLLLPAGPLREPLPASLAPGRWLLYTAGAPSTPLPGACATRRLALAWPLAAWHAGDAAAARPLAALQGRPLLAAAGLAAPEKFFAMLRAAGLQVQTLPLPDHHDYATLPWPADDPDAPDVLVTEKDAVKLDPARTGQRPVWVLPLDLTVPEPLLDALLAALFGPRHAPTATP
jgi:tetraacyldisaccharide 4'-kinase